MLYGVACLAEPGTVIGDEWWTSRLDPDTERWCIVRSNIGLSDGDCSKLRGASEGDTGSGVVHAFYDSQRIVDSGGMNRLLPNICEETRSVVS